MNINEKLGKNLSLKKLQKKILLALEGDLMIRRDYAEARDEEWKLRNDFNELVNECAATLDEVTDNSSLRQRTYW